MTSDTAATVAETLTTQRIPGPRDAKMGLDETASGANPRRPLTHSLDHSEEGLAVQATQDESHPNAPSTDLPPVGPVEGLNAGPVAEGNSVAGLAPQVIGLGRLADRFWAKVDVRGPDECWPWTGSVDAGGYGRISVGGRTGRMQEAHRVAWLIVHGRWPTPGLELDHTCHTNDPTCAGGATCPHRRCCNTRHHEEVTHAENSRRSTAAEINRARQLAITHCPAGHPYDAENTGYRADGRRRCKACDRESMRRRYAADPEHYREVKTRSAARGRAK